MIHRNNGLPARFLAWIHDNYGKESLKLIREMQLRGGKILVEKSIGDTKYCKLIANKLLSSNYALLVSLSNGL